MCGQVVEGLIGAKWLKGSWGPGGQVVKGLDGGLVVKWLKD